MKTFSANSLSSYIKKALSQPLVKPILLSTSLSLSLISNSVMADVNTSFERLNDFSGEFTINNEVTFKNGQSRSVGIPGLYRTGFFAWMIFGSDTGEITFAEPAKKIEFWVNTGVGVDAEARVLDVDGNLLHSEKSTDNVWKKVSIVAPDAGPFIGKVELENKSTSAGDIGTSVPLDDFIYVAAQAVEPEPICSVAVADPVTFNIAQGMGRMLPEMQMTGFTKLSAGQFIGNTQTMLVAEQTGQVLWVDLTSGEKKTILDISDKLMPLSSGTDEELGLVSLVLHPDFTNNGLFYTFTTEISQGNADFQLNNKHHQSVITEYQVEASNSANITVIANKQRELLRIDQPSSTNAAGSLGFDTNGLLYIGLGDGADSLASDSFGQDKNKALGKVLRIDPLGNNANNSQYGVPSDNPFVSGGGLAEVYAFGFNHPAQLSMNNNNGEMYVVDRGQSNIQEINLLTRAGNFGASSREGSYGFKRNDSGVGMVVDNCPNEISSIDPLQQYDKDDGNKIIGGYAYQGGELPYLENRFVFADAGGRLFHMNAEGTVAEIDLLDRSGSFAETVSAFARDAMGNIYVMSNVGGELSGATGKITRLLPELQVAKADNSEVDEDGSLLIEILANDGLDGNAAGVLIDPTSVNIKMQPFSGTVFVNNENGSVTYTPTADFFGEDMFSYSFSYQKDGVTIPESNEAMVHIDVNAINDAPVANNDSATVQQDSSVTISILTNDSDADGNADINNNSIVITSASANGTTNVTSSGSVTYTPNTGYTGSDSFSYTIADTDGQVSSPATVSLSVTAKSTSGGGGGSTGFLSLLLGSLMLLIRKTRD